MWKAQRWLVEFVDGPQKGFRTNVNIGYFHSFSFYDTEEEEE